ncbi:MAG: Smr/MutS family protein [Crocinitomicaceae bacterium]
MYSFHISERVTILNETGFFTVLEIRGENLLLEDEFGFERTVLRSVVCKTQRIDVNKVSQKDSIKVSSKRLLNEVEIPQIDLHSEALEEMGVVMRKEEAVLEIQVKEFKLFCNRMIDQRQTRFRVVHGIGAGILRQEIRNLLKGRKGYILHDNQVSFGRVGVSLVELRLNKAEKF